MDDQGRPPRVEEADKAPLTTAYVQHSSQAKRLRTTGQSESPQPRLPEDETPLLTWTWQPTSRPGQPSALCLLCSCVPPTTLNSLGSSQDSRSQAAVVHKCAVVTSES